MGPDGLARDVNNYHTATRLYRGNAAGNSLAACKTACDADAACHMISFKTGDCRLTGTYSPSKTVAAPVAAPGFNCYIEATAKHCVDQQLSRQQPTETNNCCYDTSASCRTSSS